MTINVRTLLVGLMAAIVASAAATAYATTRTVTSTADSGVGTLRDTIAVSAANDTIVFSNNVTGTITLTSGELGIGRNLTLIGPGVNVLTVSGNNASRVFNISGGTVSISGLTIANGRIVGTAGANGYFGHPGLPGADVEGGGILNQGTLNLNSCSLNNNSAAGGAGGQAYLTSDGGAGGAASGGAIANHGILTLIASTLNSNSASGGIPGAAGVGGAGKGGGIVNTFSLNLINCTLNNNSATGAGGGNGLPSVSYGGAGGSASGGGIANPVGSQAMANCTFSGNSANGGAGGNNVISPGNRGGDGGSASGGGVFESDSSYGNTIVANNTVTGGAAGAGFIAAAPGSAVGPDVNGFADSLGHNLIGKADGSTGWVGSDLTGTIASPLNPLLVALADNGGPTFTMALQPLSAAIDAGDDLVTNSLATDQRGHPRKSGVHVDIGAYEVNPRLTLIVSILGDSGAGSLRQAIIDVDPVVGDEVAFASGLAGTITLSNELVIGKIVTISGPTATGVTVSGNNASRVFRLTAGTTTISSLTIANGNTGGPGAGFFSQTGSTLVLSNCTVSGNVSGNSGGGVANNGTVTAVNCTFYGNRALNGGGFYNFAGKLNLFNSTVTSNAASSLSGGVYNYPVAGSFSTIRSSIIASNAAPGSPDVAGVFTSSGYNLIGNVSGGGGLTAATDQTGVDPKLGPLADNGGPTKTMALRVGSPAIDKGKSFGLATDQRGQPRYDNPNIANASGGDGADIGAYETTELRIVNAQKTGNHLRLDFINWLGTNYEVQSRSDLNTGSWGSLAGSTAGNGGIASTTVSNAFSVPKQFYRVHAVP